MEFVQLYRGILSFLFNFFWFFINLFFRLFGLSSSYIGELARVWTPLPMVLLGTPSILAALAALQLPDTKGKSLPETMEEAYELNMKNTQYYSSTYEILD